MFLCGQDIRVESSLLPVYNKEEVGQCLSIVDIYTFQHNPFLSRTRNWDLPLFPPDDLWYCFTKRECKKIMNEIPPLNTELIKKHSNGWEITGKINGNTQYLFVVQFIAIHPIHGVVWRLNDCPFGIYCSSPHAWQEFVQEFPLIPVCIEII